MVVLINVLLYLIIFIYGACIGSFLNVVIYRVPNEISIAKGRSYCPKCNTQIRNCDLIPIASYLKLKGRCRQCSEKISSRYPFVELFTGLIAVMVFMVKGFTMISVTVFIVSAILIAITMIDFDTMTIPNGLVVAIIPLAVYMALMQSDVSLWSSIIGFFAVSVPMLLLNQVIPDSFGGGDVKLIAVCGFMLGWENTLLAMFIAILIGGMYAVYLLVSGKSKRGAHIAFGPYICLGVYISMLYGNEIIKLYLGMFGL
ncbi:MAG: prepilin peptidase [Proteocatella sp.]